MALEACFQLSTVAPTATPSVNTRASTIKEKKLNLLTNKDTKRSLSSSFSSSSSSSIAFRSFRRSSTRGSYITCQATNSVDEVLEVSDDTWSDMVLGSKLPAVVEFWAPSCGPCKMVEPVMIELAKDYVGKIVCFKINTDDSLRMASKYGIRSIPTVLIFKDGKKMESVTGAVRKGTLSATIDKYLDA